MGTYADLMDALTLRVTSPDGQLAATLTGRSKLDIAFADGSYSRYTERALEEQAKYLLQSVFSAQRRAHFDALSKAQGRMITEEPPPADNRGKRYRELVAEAVATGDSRRGTVRVGNRGITEWKVRIADGTLGRLSSQEFTGELGSALQAMLRELFVKRGQLRREAYGVPVANDELGTVRYNEKGGAA